MGGLFYFIFFTTTFRIKEIRISGNQKVSTEEIRDRVQSVLFSEGDYIFLGNLGKINREILHFFPQIAEVNSKIKFPDGLIIEVNERKPVAVFCQNENSFFLDEEGIIFEEVFEVNPQQLKIKNLTISQLLNLGEKGVEKDQLLQILEIELKLKKELKIPLVEVSIISKKRLNLKTSEGWEIYLDPSGDIDWQLTKLDLVLKERIPPEKRGKVKYIDLRFERVYIFPETYRE